MVVDTEMNCDNMAFNESINAHDTNYKVKKKSKHITDGYKLDNEKANANTDVEFKGNNKAHDTSYKVKKKLKANCQSISEKKKDK